MQNLISLLLISVISQATLHGSDSNESLRELCRKDVASTLVNYYDRWTIEDQLSKKLKHELPKTEKKVQEAEAKLSAAEEEIEKNKGSFDILRIEKRDIAKANLSAAKSKLEDSHKALDAATSNAKIQKDKYQKLKTTASAVFFINDQKNKTILSTGIKYRSTCPKYREQCPLPPKERNTLITDISPLLEHNTYCQRYSQIR